MLGKRGLLDCAETDEPAHTFRIHGAARALTPRAAHVPWLRAHTGTRRHRDGLARRHRDRLARR
jgi:hypothetical protein